MDNIILEKLGWDINNKENKELTYFLKDNNKYVGTLHIINLQNKIIIEFKPKEPDLFYYYIVYDKNKKFFDLDLSSFQLDESSYLNFLDTLGKQINSQEKIYS